MPYWKDKAKLLYNTFINNQFSYAPIIWIFCRKNQHLKIQKIHHEALKVVSWYYTSVSIKIFLVVINNDKGFDELLQLKLPQIIVMDYDNRFIILDFFNSNNSVTCGKRW